jgi:hypothetical protein
MLGMEREIVGWALEGNRRDYHDPMLVSPQVRIATEDRHPKLNPPQLRAVDEILLSREKIVALDRVAGAGKGQSAQVQSVDAAINRLTVKLRDGTERTYDPRRQRGVSVFREETRKFSVGDRIQFTAPANELKIANRELGVIRDIDRAGRLNLKMGSGRSLQIDPDEHPHLDYGYAMTSHSSQGQTANRVLIHVDTELAAKDLLNNRMAYVSVSRGAFDAQLFTNDREKLPTALSHDISKQSAQSLQINTEQTTSMQHEISGRQQENSTGLGIGL